MKKTFRHNDFTATFSDEGTGPDNRYFSFTGELDGSGGAVGDKITDIYPAFNVLDDLHLATLDGVPMHALENAFYHFKKSGLHPYDEKELEKYWKVQLTDSQIKNLFRLEYLANSLGAFNDVAFPDLPENRQKARVRDLMDEIKPLWAAKVDEARKLVKNTPSDLTEIDETVSIEDFDNPEKVRALANWLDVHFSTITEDGNEYTAQGIIYTILTDSEADDAWDAELESYLDECVLPDLPENMRRYFDHDAWKEDAKKDGRGHALEHYDGEEKEITDPETKEMFFAYRN